MSNAKMYRNSRAVGNIGDQIAVSEFVKRELPVFLPFGQNTPVDILVYLNEKFLKIQVKTTEEVKNGVMEFDISRTNGFTGRRKTYEKNEVDYFFLYCVENDFRGLISYEDLNSRYSLRIRCEKTKNRQAKKINNIENYRFENKIKTLLETA